eukprot:s2641_g6.t1
MVWHVGSRRRRARWKHRRAIELLVNLQVVALNFVSGSPQCKHYGIPLTAPQKDVVSNLRERACSLSRLGTEEFSRCGSRIALASSELDRLHELLLEWQDAPYGCHGWPRSKRADAGGTVTVPLEASRVAFPDSLLGFDPLPFLNDDMSRAYHNPSSLLGHVESDAPRMMPPDVATTDTRRELRALGLRWDDASRLCLALPVEVDEADRCNLFCVSKPDGELRQIIDRRPRNSREIPPPKNAPKMGHPSSFLNIVIPDGFDLLGSVDDLRNYYHEFKVSIERALSTPIGPFWRLGEWRGTRAERLLKERHPTFQFKDNTPVLMCFAGLSMGDHWAPCIAQASHLNLLRSFDAIRDEEYLEFGHPLPRSPLGHYVGVCIDDRLNMQLVPKNFNGELRDEQACRQADRAYQAVGLSFHPKKRQRRAAVFSACGAQIEGRLGLLGIKRERLCALSWASMHAANGRLVTRAVLDSLLGSWAFAFQFRRCLFSLIHELYCIGPPTGMWDSPFKLTRSGKEELQLLSVLGPTALTQLRTKVSPTLYATDAAPAGAGAISCLVGSEISGELYRRVDFKGFHTRLLPPGSDTLHEMGYEVSPEVFSNDALPNSVAPVASLEEVLPDQPLLLPHDEVCSQLRFESKEIAEVNERIASHSRVPPPGRAPMFRFDFIEVYSGCSRLSQSMMLKGFVVGPPIDIRTGWDMKSKSLFYWLLFMCLAGRIGILWLAPPSTSFSVARHPKLRSKTHALGFDLLNWDVLVGNLHMYMSMALWVAQLVRRRVAILRTPWGAFSRHLPAWRWCVTLGGCEIRIDQCAFGGPYQRPTCLLATHHCLQDLTRFCMCTSRHVQLEGACSTAAARYLTPFCDHIASGLAHLPPWFPEDCDSGLGSKCKWGMPVPTSDPSRIFSTELAGSQPSSSSTLLGKPGSHGVDVSGPPRKFVSHLWATQLSECLPWRVCRKYGFRHPAHINILESHARRSLLLNIPGKARVVVFQDSMVALGSGAKGRSSSRSLNRVLRQECAICVAKDLYVAGIHAPTWSLRADDPSRSKRLRPPRAPLPTWFLLLKRGLVAQGQDELDKVSGLSRAWGRWFLFASAALLAVASDHDSLRSWAETASRAAGSKRSRAGKSDRTNCTAEGKAARPIFTVDTNCRSADFRSGASCTDVPFSIERAFGGVRPCHVRTGCQQAQLCRDHQCCPAKISIPERSDDWPLAARNHMGECLPKFSAPSNPLSTVEGNGECLLGLGVAPVCPDAFDRILWFVETSRNVLAESERLHAQCRQRLKRSSHFAAQNGQEPHSRRQISKRSARRALRDSFHAEMLRSYESERENLAIFGSTF